VRAGSGVFNFYYHLSDPWLGRNLDGEYTLQSGGCALQMTVLDGKVVTAVKLFILE
jgi:hypothetical protein